MNNPTLPGLLARALAVSLLLAACSAPQLAVAPRYGRFELQGDLGIGSGGAVATGSLESTGLGDEEDVLGARVDIKWGAPHLTLNTQISKHSGDGTVEVTLQQGGVTIPSGATVDSRLELGLHQALLTFDLVPTDLVELGIGFGVTLVDVDVRFRSGTEEIDSDELFPVPVLALRAGVDLGRFELSALASGFQASVDGDSAELVDVDARALFRFAGIPGSGLAGHLMVGYRWVGLDLDYDDGSDSVELDSTFKGPYVGLALTF